MYYCHKIMFLKANAILLYNDLVIKMCRCHSCVWLCNCTILKSYNNATEEESNIRVTISGTYWKMLLMFAFIWNSIMNKWFYYNNKEVWNLISNSVFCYFAVGMSKYVWMNWIVNSKNFNHFLENWNVEYWLKED